MTRIRTILSLSLFVVVFFGCEKKLFDYRNKYLGGYQFTYYCSYWQMVGTTGDTTIIDEGKIKYGDKGNIKVD
ncbi:MAG: hypothetical protein QNL61_08130 [Crocinitomicaceae bacterium]